MSTTTNLGLTVGTDKSTVDIPDFVDQTETNMGLIDAFAATVRKKPTRESFTIQVSDWGAISSVDPFKFSASVTASTTISNDTLVELINNNAVLFASCGFAIGSVSSQTITLYCVEKPSSSVTLKIDIGD